MNKSKECHSYSEFWKKHKKVISITLGLIGVTVASVGCFFGIRAYLNYTAFERWLNKASLEELNMGRNKIQNQYFNTNLPDNIRIDLWNAMKIIDIRVDKLRGGNREYVGPSYYREHGYNLYKPD